MRHVDIVLSETHIHDLNCLMTVFIIILYFTKVCSARNTIILLLDSDGLICAICMIAAELLRASFWMVLGFLFFF